MIPTEKDVLECASETLIKAAYGLEQRVIRLVEETIETARAIGVPFSVIEKITARVYSRPPIVHTSRIMNPVMETCETCSTRYLAGTWCSEGH